jgi:hypothetical protein
VSLKVQVSDSSNSFCHCAIERTEHLVISYSGCTRHDHWSPNLRCDDSIRIRYFQFTFSFEIFIKIPKVNINIWCLFASSNTQDVAELENPHLNSRTDQSRVRLSAELGRHGFLRASIDCVRPMPPAEQTGAPIETASTDNTEGAPPQKAVKSLAMRK